MRMRLVAGTLLLVSFAAIVGTVLVILQDLVEFRETYGSAMDFLVRISLYLAIADVVMGIVVLVGGISAILGKSLPLSIAGAIVGMIDGRYLFLGSICAIAAIPFLASGAQKFESERVRSNVPYPGNPAMPPHPTEPYPRLVIYPHPHSPSYPCPPDREGRTD